MLVGISQIGERPRDPVDVDGGGQPWLEIDLAVGNVGNRNGLAAFPDVILVEFKNWSKEELDAYIARQYPAYWQMLAEAQTKEKLMADAHRPFLPEARLRLSRNNLARNKPMRQSRH